MAGGGYEADKVGGGLLQTADDGMVLVRKTLRIQIENVMVAHTVGLIEYAQKDFQIIAATTFQFRHLNDPRTVVQALRKLVVKALQRMACADVRRTRTDRHHRNTLNTYQ